MTICKLLFANGRMTLTAVKKWLIDTGKESSKCLLHNLIKL